MLRNKAEGLANSLELRRIKWLCKHISRIVLAANPLDRYSTILDMVSEEVVAYVNVFTTVVKLRILRKFNRRLIVDMDWDSGEVNAKA